jgi:hypothetical protein
MCKFILLHDLQHGRLQKFLEQIVAVDRFEYTHFSALNHDDRLYHSASIRRCKISGQGTELDVILDGWVWAGL